MLQYDEALEVILGIDIAMPPQEKLPLLQANHRYCAIDLKAPIAVPRANNSAMDGYAVRFENALLDKPVPVSQRIAAGDSPKPLSKNTAARIFTGAILPANADTVIIQENAKYDAATSAVVFSKIGACGDNVRQAGEDIALSQLVLAKGERIDAAKLGVLASLGIAQLPCFKPIKVAFFSTGNELLEPGDAAAEGKIFNSNRYALLAALSTVGVEVIDMGICPDDPEKTRAMLEQASTHADCVITTGGMSVGDEDYVYQQANALGEINFWKIAIKPGKPLAFGRIGEAYFFGLPGNPVSSFITFYLFVLPWLRKCSGRAAFKHNQMHAYADFNYQNSGKRLEFLRGKLGKNNAAKTTVAIYPRQGSGVFSSVDYADVLVPIAPKTTIHRGEIVSVMAFDLV